MVRRVRGKYIFRADNVWWRLCAVFLLLPIVSRCLETIDVMYMVHVCFMSVVVTVWGSVGMFAV